MVKYYYYLIPFAGNQESFRRSVPAWWSHVRQPRTQVKQDSKNFCVKNLGKHVASSQTQVSSKGFFFATWRNIDSIDLTNYCLFPFSPYRYIFGNLPPIYEVHQKLKADLCTVSHGFADESICGDIILKYVSWRSWWLLIFFFFISVNKFFYC